MTDEKIKQELEKKFPYLNGSIVVKREGRVWVDVPLDKFEEVFAYAVKGMGFGALSAIAGMETIEGFAVIYHINKEGGIMLNLRVALEKNSPAVNTVTAHFPGADIYEREIMDLLGIKVVGLSAGHRYPLPDNWPKDLHPLRKDYKTETDKKGAPNA